MKSTTMSDLDFEQFVMRDCSRGGSASWFVEIWGHGEQTEPLYRSGFHATIEGARDDGDRWIVREAEKRTKAKE